MPTTDAQGGRRPLREWRLVLVAAVAAGLSTGGAEWLGRHLLLNRTDSLPHGLYWLGPVRPGGPRPGDVVALPVPAAVRDVVRERGYLPPRGVLMKPVAARTGDVVCLRDGSVRINGRIFSRLRLEDSAGRPLPRLGFCGPVPEGHVFLATPDARSFDSRYFGPVSLEELAGAATALWTDSSASAPLVSALQ